MHAQGCNLPHNLIVKFLAEMSIGSNARRLRPGESANGERESSLGAVFCPRSVDHNSCRNAELHSAVSQISNLQHVATNTAFKTSRTHVQSDAPFRFTPGRMQFASNCNAELHSAVSQNFNLQRIATNTAIESPHTTAQSHAPSHSTSGRMQFGDTAECNSALQSRPMPLNTGMPQSVRLLTCAPG
jgi:hypothetical protein